MVKVLIFAVLIVVWVLYIKYSVVTKKENTVKSFKALDKLLQKRYDAIKSMNSVLKNTAANEQFDVEYAEKLLSEVISLGIDEKNIDRRIVYDKELAKYTEKMISELNENPDEGIKAAIDEYNKLSTPIKNAINQYNTDAEILRYAADKFPSSFIARLMCVKYFDTI